MKPNAALLACTLVAALPLGAQNLVPNPSFEQLLACPCSLGFQADAKPEFWEKWYQSPEYFHACVEAPCFVDTLIDVPQNGFGYQPAYDGDAYVGGLAYYGQGDYREYVGCQLLQPLEVGETYDLSFYTNPAIGGSYWSTLWACNNVGLLFTMVPSIWTEFSGPEFLLRNYAHLYSAAVVSDTLNWTLVSGSFVADSAYTHMVVGNFFSDALTDTMHILPGGSLGAYYFVDQVCVRPSGGDCATAEGIEDPNTNPLQLYPNPAEDHVVLTSTKPGSAFASVVLLDASGRSVPVQVERNTAQQLTLRWAQPLSSGVYLLRAALKSGERFTERVVVH